MTSVGWAGLGAMGAPMAAVLVRAGHRVTAFDADPVRADGLAGSGVRPAASLAEAATGVDVFVVMVATAEQCEDVLFAAGGAVRALRPGSVVVVMATVGPGPMATWAGRLAGAGLRLVDAPVSGGVRRAGAGELLVMVSGEPAARAAAQPIIDALASAAPVVGATPGDGQRVKLVNQLLCGVHIAAAAEALALAESLGLDPRACWEVVRHGAAASFMLDDRGARMLGEQPAPVRSAIDIFVKDMDLVVDAARAARLQTPVAAAANRLYLEAKRAGLGPADDSALYQLLCTPRPEQD